MQKLVAENHRDLMQRERTTHDTGTTHESKQTQVGKMIKKTHTNNTEKSIQRKKEK